MLNQRGQSSSTETNLQYNTLKLTWFIEHLDFNDPRIFRIAVLMVVLAVLRVEGEVVQVVVHVDGVDLPEVDQLLQSLIDEDHADEGGEGLLCEAGDVAD